MKTFTHKGYKVIIFFGYTGTQLFINDPKGIEIYAHKVSGNPVARAEAIISQQ